MRATLQLCLAMALALAACMTEPPAVAAAGALTRGRRLAQQPACSQCPSSALQTCSALTTAQQDSIRNNLIGNCATMVLTSGLALNANSCCSALPAQGTSDWTNTVSCMW